jgi:hypothetical protein
MTDSRQYTSRRLAIVEALVEKLKLIDGTGNYTVDLGDNVHPRLLFWDEIKEFPAVHVTAGSETRTYQGGGHKDRHLSVTVRCYVKNEDPVKTVEGLLSDVEYIVEENGRLVYQDRSGAFHTTRDIVIVNIDTDEGVLSPYGIGDILLQVHY